MFYRQRYGFYSVKSLLTFHLAFLPLSVSKVCPITIILDIYLQAPHSVPQHYHTVVLVGCVCCLVQTMFTLLLLLPYWWHYRTCLIFLKLQCCTATSGAMGVFIYAVRDSIPNVSIKLSYYL